MFARLKGIITKNDLNSVIIDVNGVGYLVYCSVKTMDKLIDGEAISLDIETIVREDSIKLYGFIDTAEKQWFNLLSTVQGVGFKVAIAILNALSTEELNTAILSGDKTMITKADGVGPKLAGRIALELKDKVGNISDNILFNNVSAPSVESKDLNDAISALMNLGYNRSKAFMAVNAVKEYKDLNELIRKALKELTS